MATSLVREDLSAFVPQAMHVLRGARRAPAPDGPGACDLDLAGRCAPTVSAGA